MSLKHAPSKPASRPAAPGTPSTDVVSEELAVRARDLAGIALRRLPAMIDARSGLCVLRTDGHEMKPSSQSPRYTAMVAIGLARAEDAGLATHVDRAKLVSALGRVVPSLDGCGDLGLVVWASARDGRAVAERALEHLEAHGPLTARRSGDAFHTTDLAWVVTGLCEALAHGVGDERRVRSLLDDATSQLEALRGKSGLHAFSRAAPGRQTLLHRLRARLGFFDGQVYSILAACRRHEVLGDRDAIARAQQTARVLLKEQGPLGQWPWHWDAATGRVVDAYPVYSVHQHGMAPMALFPLERATGLAVGEPVLRGVRWLFGHNELGVALANTARDVCWRSIRRRAPLRRAIVPLKAAALTGIGPALDLARRTGSPRLLEIDRELRPYELGWCLLALADRAAGARSRTAA